MNDIVLRLLPMVLGVALVNARLLIKFRENENRAYITKLLQDRADALSSFRNASGTSNEIPDFLGFEVPLGNVKQALKFHRPINDYRRVCYYSDNTDDLPAEKLVPELCTHLIFAFVIQVNGTVQVKDEEQAKRLKAFMSLKKQHADVVFMTSIGTSMAEVVPTEDTRRRFAESAAQFLRQNGLDGLDLDWEFPASGGKAEEKHQFTLLLEEITKAFATDAKYHSPRLLLTAAIAAPKELIHSCYEPAQMALYVDFINLMSYDYHFYSWYDRLTNNHSPLFSRKLEFFYFGTENTAWSANEWNKLGMPKEKINIGIPCYARTFELMFASWHWFYSPATGPGQPGNGWLHTDEICQLLNASAVEVFDEEDQASYLYADKLWAGYNNERSVEKKCEWLKQEGYGGAMTWNLNTDDWQGHCDGVTTFPLHRAMKKVLSDV